MAGGSHSRQATLRRPVLVDSHLGLESRKCFSNRDTVSLLGIVNIDTMVSAPAGLAAAAESKWSTDLLGTVCHVQNGECGKGIIGWQLNSSRNDEFLVGIGGASRLQV